MTLEVYGIPTCGTCKKALQWLDTHGVTYQFINTKEHPPTAATIASWVEVLGSKALRNTSGQSYRALGVDKQSWSDLQWIEAFAQDAMLIKRPVIVAQGKPLLAGFRGNDDQLRAQLHLT